ncbi:uncharacterized protein LOC133370935 isoform X2 [Rhineura floridana]|uniref:uncharacterized protein LOC133370935 isoform X2 n=1 Tax=Rhineura floridana TaxID=261503 RepID=UPI002AC826FE|nr:uncharacterized protein LOC133370935 isoform X2 [Rhineura floridana]
MGSIIPFAAPPAQRQLLTSGAQDPSLNHHEVCHPHTGLGCPDRHLTEQGFSTVARPFSDLERKLPTEVTETAELVFGVPGKVVEKVITGLHDLQRYGRPTVEDFYKELQSALAVYVDPVLERVGPYTETLRLTLVARIQKPDPKLDEKLLQQLESLRIQLHPNIKKLEDFQTSLKPYVDEAQKLFRKGVETVHKHLLQPYIAPIMQMSQKYKGEFKKWAATPLFPPNP